MISSMIPTKEYECKSNISSLHCYLILWSLLGGINQGLHPYHSFSSVIHMLARHHSLPFYPLPRRLHVHRLHSINRSRLRGHRLNVLLERHTKQMHVLQFANGGDILKARREQGCEGRGRDGRTKSDGEENRHSCKDGCEYDGRMKRKYCGWGNFLVADPRVVIRNDVIAIFPLGVGKKKKKKENSNLIGNSRTRQLLGKAIKYQILPGRIRNDLFPPALNIGYIWPFT